MKKIKHVIAIIMLFVVTETGTKHQGMRTSIKNEDVQKRTGVAKKKCNNLICIFDPDQDESVFGDNPAMGYSLMDALQEKVAPIIVTTNIVENFCYWKTHNFEVIRRNLFRGYPGCFFISVVMATNFNEWDCYFHKRAGLVLLIPKKYIETHATLQNYSVEDQIVQCGFDIENLEKIKQVSYSAILEYIKKHKPLYDRIINDFESMFVQNVNRVSPIRTWNIFVTGHGGAAKNIEIVKTSEQKINKSIKQVQSRIRQIQQEKFEDYEKELNIAKKRLRVLLRELKHVRSQGAFGQVGSSWIAGLKYEDFIQLMDFFEQGIKASYVHYISCFSGGFNQTLLNQELSSLNVNFIVSNQGINESITRMARSEGLAKFFTKLETLMCESSELVNDQESLTVLIKDLLGDILGDIVMWAELDYAQPFIRIPSVGVFKAVDMLESVKLLTHSLVKAHEAEGSPIDCTDSSIKTIFIYPSHIAVPLKIKDHVAIVSPVPQTLEGLQKPTIHIIEKMFYQDNLSSIIPNFISFNTRYQSIIFVIKELHCLDGQYLKLDVGDNKSIVLKDMIMHIAPTESSQNKAGTFLDISIDVVFNYNGSDYSISRRVKQLQENMGKLFDTFKQGKCEPIARENLTQLAEKIIGKGGVAQLVRENKEITLSSMVEYFEGQIGGALRVEKMQNLQHPVLLKKMKKIERITSDVALKLQKELITKTGSKPNLSWVHRLERLMSIVRDALEHINRLLVSEKDNATILSHKEKIESILKTLTQEYESAITQLSWKEWSVMNVEPVSKKVGKIRDEMINRIEQLRKYIRGEEEQLKQGYGKPR